MKTVCKKRQFFHLKNMHDCDLLIMNTFNYINKHKNKTKKIVFKVRSWPYKHFNIVSVFSSIFYT